MAPAIYLEGFGPAGGATDPTLPRQMERATAALTGLDPVTGKVEKLALYQVDQPGLKALHMITADANRTPTYVMFGNTNFYFNPVTPSISQETGYAWNHGGVAPEINTTWVAFVGPGVKHGGIDRDTWSDHVDIRPTMLLLAGLKDDYASDGRVLTEGLTRGALPAALRQWPFEDLAAAYKQINAPIGAFGQGALKVSTKALASNEGNDGTYNFLETRLSALTSERDTLAAQIRDTLDDVEFNGSSLGIGHAIDLLVRAELLQLKMDILVEEAH
jgi:hypothetical protein